jgi:hypothetical protein
MANSQRSELIARHSYEQAAAIHIPIANTKTLLYHVALYFLPHKPWGLQIFQKLDNRQEAVAYNTTKRPIF